MRIVLMIGAEDFRKGIDSLCATCRKVLEDDPFSGHIFVFRNRNKTAIKLLAYDGQGFWLFHKRLSKGKFKWWPEISDAASTRLAAYQLQLLIYNGNPTGCGVNTWREIAN
jgi:transposase